VWVSWQWLLNCISVTHHIGHQRYATCVIHNARTPTGAVVYPDTEEYVSRSWHVRRLSEPYYGLQGSSSKYSTVTITVVLYSPYDKTTQSSFEFQYLCCNINLNFIFNVDISAILFSTAVRWLWVSISGSFFLRSFLVSEVILTYALILKVYRPTVAIGHNL
jgi:hypothetical protein